MLILNIIMGYYISREEGMTFAGSLHLDSHCVWGGTKSRNGEMRNEKLEMRKWKRKWKWSSLLLVDAIVYLWCIKRSAVKVLFVKL